MQEGTKQPLLLPKDDYYTQLIIDHVHRSCLHAGVAQTLAQVRQKYWIPQGRSAVKRILKKCIVYRRWEGGPYQMPPMPPLSRKRVTKARVGRKNPQKLTQLSSRSHPRHLVGKRTAQKDITKDTTSDSQVNSNFPNRWSPASLTFNNYFYILQPHFIYRNRLLWSSFFQIKVRTTKNVGVSIYMLSDDSNTF